jgi:hypothetical protein
VSGFVVSRNYDPGEPLSKVRTHSRRGLLPNFMHATSELPRGERIAGQRVAKLKFVAQPSSSSSSIGIVGPRVNKRVNKQKFAPKSLRQ